MKSDSRKPENTGVQKELRDLRKRYQSAERESLDYRKKLDDSLAENRHLNKLLKENSPGECREDGNADKSSEENLKRKSGTKPGSPKQNVKDVGESMTDVAITAIDIRQLDSIPVSEELSVLRDDASRLRRNCRILKRALGMRCRGLFASSEGGRQTTNSDAEDLMLQSITRGEHCVQIEELSAELECLKSSQVSLIRENKDLKDLNWQQMLKMTVDTHELATVSAELRMVEEKLERVLADGSSQGGAHRIAVEEKDRTILDFIDKVSHLKSILSSTEERLATSNEDVKSLKADLEIQRKIHEASIKHAEKKAFENDTAFQKIAESTNKRLDEFRTDLASRLDMERHKADKRISSTKDSLRELECALAGERSISASIRDQLNAAQGIEIDKDVKIREMGDGIHQLKNYITRNVQKYAKQINERDDTISDLSEKNGRLRKLLTEQTMGKLKLIC